MKQGGTAGIHSSLADRLSAGDEFFYDLRKALIKSELSDGIKST